MDEYYQKVNSLFESNKKIFDEVYQTNKNKYGPEQANVAMYEFFVNYRTDYITRTNDARKKMDKFMYHGSEIEQFLLDYAMSSYSLNGGKVIPIKEIQKYVNNDPNLAYDRNTVIALVAIGSAHNPYWMVNILACNPRVKEVLVESLIDERYIQNKKQELDNSRRAKLIKFDNGDKSIMMSRDSLNRSIDNMIHDDGATYYQDDDNDYGQVNREVR